MKKNKKITKKVNNEIHDVFEDLQIKPYDYPPYENPDSFASRFKKCTIYKSEGLLYSSSSSSSEVFNSH